MGSNMGGVGGSTTSAFGSRAGSRMNSLRNSKMHVDLKALDKLVSNLLEQHTAVVGGGGSATAINALPAAANQRKASVKLNRWRPTSRSAHAFNIVESSAGGGGGGGGGGAGAGNAGSAARNFGTELAGSVGMPTIMESGIGVGSTAASATVTGNKPEATNAAWSASLERKTRAARNVLQRLSQSANDEETLNLTQNFVP